jgi:hypothetical protein
MAVMTADECHQRARDAKALAVETQDLWEREMLFKIAGQWQLVAAHRAAKKAQPVLKLVPGQSIADRHCGPRRLTSAGSATAIDARARMLNCLIAAFSAEKIRTCGDFPSDRRPKLGG